MMKWQIGYMNVLWRKRRCLMLSIKQANFPVMNFVALLCPHKRFHRTAYDLQSSICSLLHQHTCTFSCYHTWFPIFGTEKCLYITIFIPQSGR